MTRLCIPLLLILSALAGCDKEHSGSCEIFYGTWVKGSSYGDTIRFYHKDGRNILWSNQSFNPSMQSPLEQEFRMQDGNLAADFGTGLAGEWHVMDSFTWKTAGKQFEISGYQLYLFMSSTETKFTFTKVH